MTALSTFPSPSEIEHLLQKSPDPSEPSTDLATLERFVTEWPYPQSLDCREGFIFADLCLQAGWAYLRHEEFESALAIWRRCPWQQAVAGERQAIAHLLQAAYEDRSLVIGPPAADLLAYGRLPLGALLATLDDPASVLGHAASGVGYVVETSLVQPDGLYQLRFEFDQSTLFYISFLPTEVHHQLLTARACFQMGEPLESATWLLRAAFTAHNRGLEPEAFSFLEKALQLAPENAAVQASLTNLRAKGVTPTLFSRVVIERTLFQPDMVKRCEQRPETLPEPDSIWLDPDWTRGVSEPVFAREEDSRVVSLGLMAMDVARPRMLSVSDRVKAWPLLLPAAWKVPSRVDTNQVERGFSRVRGLSLEKLGLWKSDYRPVLAEMVSHWSRAESQVAEPEVIDFALPKEAQLVLFACSEVWQVPLFLELELAELKSTVVLAAWWRRLQRIWNARPFLIADDVIWFQMDKLPESSRRELFLADLLSFSSDVAECFEPDMIRSAGENAPFLFPVPLQLSFPAAP